MVETTSFRRTAARPTIGRPVARLWLGAEAGIGCREGAAPGRQRRHGREAGKKRPGVPLALERRVQVARSLGGEVRLRAGASPMGGGGQSGQLPWPFLSTRRATAQMGRSVANHWEFQRILSDVRQKRRTAVSKGCLSGVSLLSHRVTCDTVIPWHPQRHRRSVGPRP